MLYCDKLHTGRTAELECFSGGEVNPETEAPCTSGS
jgi:hypothetical protein